MNKPIRTAQNYQHCAPSPDESDACERMARSMRKAREAAEKRARKAAAQRYPQVIRTQED
jgi:hypothetical protein